MNVPAPGRFAGALTVKVEKPAEAPLLIRLRFLHDGEVAVERRFVLPAGAGSDAAYRSLAFNGEFMNDGPYTVEVRSSGAAFFWFDRLEIVR